MKIGLKKVCFLYAESDYHVHSEAAPMGGCPFGIYQVFVCTYNLLFGESRFFCAAK